MKIKFPVNKCFHANSRYLSLRNGLVRGVLLLESRDDVLRWGRGGGAFAAAAAPPAGSSDAGSELVLQNTLRLSECSANSLCLLLNRSFYKRTVNKATVKNLPPSSPFSRHQISLVATEDYRYVAFSCVLTFGDWTMHQLMLNFRLLVAVI